MYKIDDIKKNYESFDDFKIQRIAENEAKGLRDEIVPILIHEIQKRNLGDDLIKWINAERRILKVEELEKLKKIVKESLCQSCKKEKNLRGYKFRTITGVLVDEIVSYYKLIVCQNCGKKKRRNSFVWTSIFGWWSLRGLFLVPIELFRKIKAIRNAENQSDEIIENFIKDNIGEITINNDSQEVVLELLKAFNKIEGELEDD